MLVVAFSPLPTMFSKGLLLKDIKCHNSTVKALTLSQTSPGFYVSAVQVDGKHSGKWRNCS